MEAHMGKTRTLLFTLRMHEVPRREGDVVTIRTPPTDDSGDCHVALKYDVIKFDKSCAPPRPIDPSHDITLYDRYIFGCEPLLEEILRAPVRARLANAESERSRLYGIILEFNNLPWWKRAWVATRHGIKAFTD